MAIPLDNNVVATPYGGGANFMSVYDTIARKPQAYAELLQKYGEGLGVFNFLNLAEKTVPLTTNSLKIIEQGNLERLVTLDTCNTTAAHSVCDLVFNVADGSAAYVREGFDIIIPGAYNNKNVDKPMRIYLSGSDWKGRFWDDTATIDASAAGVSVAVGASAFGYGTGQPKAMSSGYFERTTGNRIFKETTGLEGSQLYKEDFYAVEAANGAKGILTKGTIEADFRLDSQIDAALLLSEANDSTSYALASTSSITGESSSIPSFDGLVPTMRKLGLSLDWTTNFDMAKFQAVKALLESVGVLNRNVDFFYGSGLGANIETNMTTWLNSNSPGTILYDQMGKIGFQVREIKINSVTFKLMELHSFANPVKFGASAHAFTNMGMMFPQGNRKVTLNGAGGVKESLQLGHLTLGYPSGKGEDRKRVFTSAPGVTNTSPIAVTDKDGSFYYMMAEVIPIWSYMNQTILIQKLTA